MNGIKTISDGVALIQNGNATFNTINVETITSSNLTDCNLNNCTTNDPTNPQSVVNKKFIPSIDIDKEIYQELFKEIIITIINNINNCHMLDLKEQIDFIVWFHLAWK